MNTEQVKTVTITDIAAAVGINAKTARSKLRSIPKKELPATVGDGWTFAAKDRAKVKKLLAA